MREQAIVILGPEETVCGVLKEFDTRSPQVYGICAFIDPAQNAESILVHGYPVYNNLEAATRNHETNLVVYAEWLLRILIVGCAA